MSSEQFALFLRVIRAPVFGRAYSAAPTRFHAHLYQILRKLEGEGRKYFDFKPHVVLTDLPDDAAQISETNRKPGIADQVWEIDEFLGLGARPDLGN